MRRSRIRPKRKTPRRREAPRWSREEWEAANHLLAIRSEGRCERCGFELQMNVERHHRQKRTVGGDRFANLMYLHPACHAWITEHPAEAVDRGWIVPTYANPLTVPVFWQGREWSLLEDDGSRARHESWGSVTPP
jgi:5-methylcytosine-specific restriction endonuclease McrA